jgi:hypothetical protein
MMILADQIGQNHATGDKEFPLPENRQAEVVPAGIADAGRALAVYEFPVVMRNSQYGSFGWAKPLENKR